MSLRLLTTFLLGCLLLGCTGSEQPTAPGSERDEFDRFGIDRDPNRPWRWRDDDSSGGLRPGDFRWCFGPDSSWRTHPDSCPDVRWPRDWSFDPPDSLRPDPYNDDSTFHSGWPDSTWFPPDPFRGDTLITFHIFDEGSTTVVVRNRGGIIRDTVLDVNLEEGEYSIYWDGVLSDGTVAPPGVYFYLVYQDHWRMRGMFLRFPQCLTGL